MRFTPEQLEQLRTLTGLGLADLAQLLDTSLVGISRWERGLSLPSASQARRISELLDALAAGMPVRVPARVLQNGTFASRGSSRKALLDDQPGLFSPPAADKTQAPGIPVLERTKKGIFLGDSQATLAAILKDHTGATETPAAPWQGATSAGKNTYTYDAHTYHTKVPPQAILEAINYYLPRGGLVLDPFAGSGMTGVASLVAGTDVVLNELSPAACFISHCFTEKADPTHYAQTIKSIVQPLSDLRRSLYTTVCRECGRDTEILYTVWSYYVLCPHCGHEFRLWDHCRSYGRTVREHRILSEFQCPRCQKQLKKRLLERTHAEPVLLGYKCCTRVQVEHELAEEDFDRIKRIESDPPLAHGYFPINDLPEGANLSQPRRHGLTSVDRLYTVRNLSALSHIWREIHTLEDDQLVSLAAFTFTSLYQRVTRLSEFRFWGGSGNAARLNVPFIFNEANVFATFERKAASILDHLQTTAATYRSRRVVACNSATHLSYLPDNSVDYIFTDPPFGGNINYSDMNLLWESWLGQFTDPTDEAIINRFQGKGLDEYEELMTCSLSECYRVLRPGHWMSLVFMNSSESVWCALREAIRGAGFRPASIYILDKQHGTQKQFVSENTAGFDLVLHCIKPQIAGEVDRQLEVVSANESVRQFLSDRSGPVPFTLYHHVIRAAEVDFRMLYSEWIAYGLARGHSLTDFVRFRTLAADLLDSNQDANK